MCFLTLKKYKGVFKKVHRVERPASSSVFYKVCNSIGKMLFFRRQAHLCTISVRFHKKNDFFKLFRLIVCFVLIKSYKICQKKRMRNARAKKSAPSKIVLISGLGNKGFQLFTEIINLAAKFQFVTLCKHQGTSNSFVSTKITPAPTSSVVLRKQPAEYGADLPWPIHFFFSSAM